MNLSQQVLSLCEEVNNGILRKPILFKGEKKEHFDTHLATHNIPDGNHHIVIGDKHYHIATEAWHDGCLESRGMEKTHPRHIQKCYKDLMSSENNFHPVDIHGYEPKSPEGTHGVSYIGREIK
jgi:hypothetical protein